MNKLLIYILILILIIPSSLAIDILGVSNVNYISNDKELNGNAMLVTVTSGYDGTGKIQAKQLSDDGFTATKDFEIKTINEKYSCDYTFIQNKNFGSFGGVLVSIKVGDNTYYTQQGCIDNKPSDHIYLTSKRLITGFAPDTKYTCFYVKPIANIGYVSQPSNFFQIQFEATNQEQTVKSQILTSNGGSTGSIDISKSLFNLNGENLAIIKWSGGGLQSPNMCPTASTTNTIALKNLNSNSFILASKDNLDNWNINSKNLLNSLSSTLELTRNAVDDQVRNINTIVNNPGNINYLVGENGKRYNVVDSDGKKQIQLERPFIFPLFTLKIKANFIGVVQNVGIPKIISYTSQGQTFEIKSGVGSNVAINVKNVGLEDATFKTYLECAGDILSNYDVKSVIKGSTNIFNIYVNSNQATKVTEKCTIVVEDINNAKSRDTASLTITSTSSGLCSSGVETCIGNSLYICEKGINIETKCKNGCNITSTNKAECINGDDDDKTEGSFNYIKFIIFTLLGIIGGAFAYDKTKFGRTKRSKMFFKVLIGIATALFIIIGLPAVFTLVIPTLSLGISVVVMIISTFGFWFVNSTTKPGKTKTIIFLILAIIFFISVYGIYKGITNIQNTISAWSFMNLFK